MPCASSKKYPTRKSQNSGDVPLKTSSSDICAICYGAYTDDFDAASGKTTADWIQCSEQRYMLLVLFVMFVSTIFIKFFSH